MTTFAGDWPIPKRIVLPGARIRVKVAPGEDAKVLAGRDGAWIYDPAKGGAIVVDGNLPLPVQRYVLLHELLHAVHDVIDVMLEDHPECVQLVRSATTRGTARENSAATVAAASSTVLVAPEGGTS